MPALPRLMAVAALPAVALLLSACATAPRDPAAACAAMAAPLDAALIGLPTRGATIESATLTAASLAGEVTNPPFRPTPPEMIVPALPEHCRVIGAIAAVDPQAPPIRFQVNLPSDWNGRSLQYGGGGFNGTLITGLAMPPASRPDRPHPLSRGYVTYGTDSGHQNAPNVPLQAFALNDEALVNFSHASYKKVRDVAVELMKRRYGKAPEKLYFFGSSEGGREGLTMAQRYPRDFDGIFSRVPVINWVGLQAAGTRMGIALSQGWISPDKVKLIADAALNACDTRDGLKDGIISDHEGCKRIFDVSSLRCPGPTNPMCLTEAEIRAVQTLHSSVNFSFDLANGVRSYPGFGIGGEAASGSGPVGGWVSWQTGTAPPTVPATNASSRAWLYGSGAVQYFLARDPNYDPRQYTPDSFRERAQAISSLMDSTNPDLSVFAGRGGKLVVAEQMADYAQSPYAGIQYYQSVVSKMGQPAVDRFMRMYVTPGADHVGVGAPSAVDMLEVVSNWVERGTAPGDLVQSSHQTAPPFGITASRPMCRYPMFPRYRSGDVNTAASFECVVP
ncbi:MAG: tannase/feruloyl esterase family alpha/beta hydrolase [Alphaproteobacteria bacterium]|nr:tannase/feruloyl esterase family alpha/beta hydrolase [Alphaproteobacteria bacterium]